MSELAATFRKPFAEQVAAFRLRMANLVPTARWDDISHSQHDRAFMVAGALKADLLADLAGAVDKAISQGTTFDEFKRDFRALVTKHGWHGWTGEGTAKGEEWRMRVIYKTNVRQSYMAGRLAQLIDGDYAFWIYLHGGSAEPRLQHLAWHGIALPPDHPFWLKHLPPNGWGCSCLVEGARTEAGIRRMGGDPIKTLPDGWDQLNPKTGAPVGIDKGWDYAPGASVTDEITQVVAAKVNRLPTPIATDLQEVIKQASVDDSAEVVLDLMSRLVDDEFRHNVDELRGYAGHVSEGGAGDNLSLGERIALRAYTHVGWHARLTQYQRLRAKGSTPEDPDMEHFGTLIDRSVARLPAQTGTVSRGIAEPPPALLAWFETVETGTQFGFEALSSFSQGQGFSGQLRFVVQGLSGRSVQFLSAAGTDEMEILFPRGLQFKVLSRTYRDGITTIWAEELRPHRYRDLPLEARHAAEC